MDTIRMTLLTVILLLLNLEEGIEMARITRDTSHIIWSEQFPELQSFNSRIAAKNKQVFPAIIRSHDQSSIGDDMDDPHARFPLPGPIPIDIEELKKIAQILTIIGEQILPSILNPPNSEKNTKANVEEPTDEINS